MSLEKHDLSQVASTSSYKTSVVITFHNQQGSIFKVVSQFALRNVNIVKMETRPATTGGSAIFSTSPRHWDYLFFIDFEPSRDSTINKALLDGLREFSVWMRELGTYPTTLARLEVRPPTWSSVCDVVSF